MYTERQVRRSNDCGPVNYVKPFGPVVNVWTRAAITVGTERRITIKYDILVYMHLYKINDSGQLCRYVS